MLLHISEHIYLEGFKKLILVWGHDYWLIDSVYISIRLKNVFTHAFNCILIVMYIIYILMKLFLECGLVTNYEYF